MKTRWGGMFAAAAAALLISAVAASSASAILKKLPNGQIVSYQPLRRASLPTNPGDTAFGNLDYNGGAVMPANEDYLIFWSPTGYTAYGSPGNPPEYVTGIEQYWKDLAHDSGLHTNTDSVSAQYNDRTGAFARYKVVYGGAFLDTDPYPTSQCPAAAPVTHCFVDAQLQAELEKFAAAHGLKRDLSHEFFLITPPHVEGCMDSNPSDPTGPYGGCSAGEAVNAVYCAYHQQTLQSPMLFYADDPYVTGNPGCDDGNHPNGPSDGALEGGMSHEHNESITDPIPNDTWTNGAGANHGEELGDQCDGHMGTTLGTHNGASYNQVINGHFYWYQEEWSNDGHTCLQRYTPPTTLPHATYTATADSGLAMTFNASASTAPGGIRDFSWQFNAVTNQATFEQTTPSITYTFPATGAYSTGLTVFAKTSGLSIGAGGIITTGHSGFVSGLSFSPASPAAGQTVTFTGLSKLSQKPVSNWLWEFGDGTTGSGQKPTHTYAAAGKYKVEVIEFSGVGSAFPGSGAAPIAFRFVTVS